MLSISLATIMFNITLCTRSTGAFYCGFLIFKDRFNIKILYKSSEVLFKPRLIIKQEFSLTQVSAYPFFIEKWLTLAYDLSMNSPLLPVTS